MIRLGLGMAFLAAIGLAGPPTLRADDKKGNPDPATELAAIQKEWNDAQQAFFKAYQEAKTNEDKQKVLKEKRPKPDAFAERFLKLAERVPDSPQATQALAWVLGNARGTPAAKQALDKLKVRLLAINDLAELQKGLSSLPPPAVAELAPSVAEKAKKNLEDPKAVPLLVWVCSSTLYGPTKELGKLYNDTIDLLLSKFPERPELAPLPNWLIQDEDPVWAAKHLRTLMEKNPSDEVKANAKFGLGMMLVKEEATQGEGEKLLQTVIDEFDKQPARAQLVATAKAELDEIRVRGIGKPVPDIAGDDLDGKAFKLSEYKGKVVLLDFWGFW